ncbi:MAG: hypothetical protein MZV49_10245 [Rhodopseudomonas palustris]|nr:hypothetical protein [Rhodopseudomonas palustris]
MTLETEALLIALYRQCNGGSLLRLGVERADQVGGFHRLARGDADRARMRANDPTDHWRRLSRSRQRSSITDAIAIARQTMPEHEVTAIAVPADKARRC